MDHNFVTGRRQHLHQDVERLAWLLRRYSDDRRFQETGTIVFAVDYTEIKGYLEPEDLGTQRGFTFAFEQPDSQYREEPGLDQIQLHEQLMRRLLFDLGTQRIVLPPHWEEFANAVEFQEFKWFEKATLLLETVRKQIERARREFKADIGDMRRLARVYREKKQMPLAENERRELINWFGGLAKDVLTLFDPPPARQRLEYLIDNGALVDWDLLSWHELGLGDWADELSSLVANRSEIERWWRLLSERRRGPAEFQSYGRNSWRDAEAIALLQTVNKRLNAIADGGGPRVRIVLVTRSPALIDVMRRGDQLQAVALEPMYYLRHPRLIAWPSANRDVRLTSELEDSLTQALDQVAAQLKDSDNLDVRRWGQAVERLRDAWQAFDADLTIVANRNELIERPEIYRQGLCDREDLSDDTLVGLFDVFTTDGDIVEAVLRLLEKTIGHLLQQTLTEDPEDTTLDNIPLKALVSPSQLIRGGARIALLSSRPGTILEIEGWDNPTLAENAVQDIRAPLSQLINSRAAGLLTPCRAYLATALRHSAAGNWRQAEVFADRAVYLAKYSQGLTNTRASTERERFRHIAHEGLYLKSQAIRFQGIEDNPSNYQRSLRTLDEAEAVNRPSVTLSRSDPRVLIERAMLKLETALGKTSVVKPNDGTIVSKVVSLAEEAEKEAKGESYLELFTVGVRLIAWLVAINEPQLAIDFNADPAVMKKWHRDLLERFETLRRDNKLEEFELPVRIQLLSILGRVDFQTSEAVDLRYVDVGQRIRAPYILQSLSQRDEIGKLLYKTFAPLAKKLESSLYPKVIYAPIWSGVGSAAVSSVRDRRCQRMIQRAYDALRWFNGAQTLELGPEHPSENAEDVAKKFDDVASFVEARREQIADNWKDLLFTMKMEAAYAKFRAWVDGDAGPLRERLRSELIDQYTIISKAYPTAAVPLFRKALLLYDRDKTWNIQPKLGSYERPRFERDRAAAIITLREAHRFLCLNSESGGDRFIESTHWVRSTITRRLAWQIVEETVPADDIKHELSVREHYAFALYEALRILLDVERQLLGVRYEDNWGLEETERRRNEIVFWCYTLISEKIGTWDDLSAMGITLETFRMLLESFAGNVGLINRCQDAYSLDTAMKTWAMLGEKSLAAAAAARCLSVLEQQREEFSDEELKYRMDTARNFSI